MANIVLDFLHNYQTGERRETEPANAYQYDEGHVLEAVVPVAVTSCEIQYWIRGMEKADAYTPTSITQNTDNTYTILGNIPNSYFENSGDLRVYIVVTDGDASITTYEGYIHIKERQMPEDYVDDDPDNDAVQIIAAARGYAETSEAWAVGQINGEDVPSTADQYQNNASYYAGQAASAASSAAAQASLAPAYDNTATYAVGDYCLHDGRLYECTTAIATAEAWTAAHWTAVTVGGELSTLKDDLTTVESDVTDLKDGLSSVENNILTDDIKQALLQIAEMVAYIDEDGQDYYDALEDALYPTAKLVSISAVYTQSGTVYDTDTLDSLKSDLVVTAHMSDGTTKTVTTYTLSGTLVEGTSTITVIYSEKTTTFNVVVTGSRYSLEYQGNYTLSTPSDTRVTLITNELTLAYGETITISVPSDYKIFPIVGYGTGGDTSKDKTVKAQNEIYVNGISNGSGYVYTTSDMVYGHHSAAKIITTTDWGQSRTYQIPNSSVTSITFSGLAFFVEKVDGGNITIADAKSIVTIA